MKLIDLTGKRFGRLTVIGRGPFANHRNPRWNCICDCGKESIATGQALREGKSRSCGCLSREITGAIAKVTHTTHGKKGTLIYTTWMGMMERCKRTWHPNYQGRGITVCERWQSFENFYADMGDRPTPKHSVDRIDNDKGYSLGNCRWATMKEQQNNRRNNVVMTFNEDTMTLTQWAEHLNIRSGTISMRLKDGWSIEEALTTPVRKMTFKHHAKLT